MSNRIKKGDHLRVQRGPYAHDGIAINARQVAHFTGIKHDKASGRIQLDLIDTFIAGAEQVEVIEYGASYPPDAVVRRALSCLGQGEYQLFSWNCQHFARWCKTGEVSSDQVERAVAVTIGGSLTPAVSSLGLGAIAAAAVEGTGGAAATMSGLAAVGGSAVGGLFTVAAAPAAVATLATHRVLRDDPFLPYRERAARRSGRWASTVGALGGTGVSLALVAGAGVPGMSAAGITSGLAAIGGTMAGGLLVAGLLPAAMAATIGFAAYKLHKRHA